nr:hepatic leukemia factor [Hymenolepis microstoma]
MSNKDYTRQHQELQSFQSVGLTKMEPKSGISGSCSTKSSKSKQSGALHMEEEKYIALRKRNNIAVRKSREKQRAKQNEVIKTLSVLREENSSLQSTVAARIRELNLLNSLLKQVKHAPPERLSKILSAYSMDHTSVDLCIDNQVPQPSNSSSSNFSNSSSPKSIPPHPPNSNSAASQLISTTLYQQMP